MARWFAAAREAFGWEFELMVDCHGRLNLPNAIRLDDALAPYRLLFIEEPLPPESADEFARLVGSQRDADRRRRAAGEPLGRAAVPREGRAERAPVRRRELRRLHRRQEDRGDGRGLLRADGAAQPQRPDRDARGRAPHVRDPQRADPRDGRLRRRLRDVRRDRGQPAAHRTRRPAPRRPARHRRGAPGRGGRRDAPPATTRRPGDAATR